ncbi:unnamed protein product [Anisakis simplex]|uniref:General transcription factor IIH subunit 2 (inferred by orthology to a C. elegans protein) n=1 Tax=Anisakis simplex TaxID=6269 RepID=A0A0M3K4C5_ANISI|nr:unnamed protein product [Anisakis simplex]
MCADINDDEEQKGYTWEAAYADALNIREVLEEDDSGSVEKSVAKLIFDAKRKRRLTDRPARVRLGIMRYVYIVIDCSMAMTDKTLLPSKISVTLKILSRFLEKFSEQNPISQIGVIICKDKRAERLIQLTGSIRAVRDVLSTINQASCHGEFSLQNGLLMALKNLKHFPGHASREVIVVVASVSTCDPTNIFQTFEVNSDEFFKIHLKLKYFVLPVKYFVAFCSHLTETRRADGRGFLCPQCGARYCGLPVECRVCKLMLISAPQLARSFHHLLPLPAFKEVDTASGVCFGCSKALESKSFACKQCETKFCLECDMLLHESLQLCPACHIMGKGTTSVAVGAPGLSRKTAYENRMHSLATEMKQLGKTNKIVDRRLGERDSHMTQEERIVKRFTAERLNAFKSNKFQLTDPQDEDELTHRGSALTAIQKYDRVMSDDEDDNDAEAGAGNGQVSAEVVSRTHFGGGDISTESQDDGGDNRYLRRKELIAELIAKSKQQRYDKQLARDQQEDTTERLDEQWNKLMHSEAIQSFTNAPNQRNNRSNQIAADKSDPYDQLFTELKLDTSRRGEASERQKTEEEIARDEREKLVELERERIARMHDHSDERKSIRDTDNIEDLSSSNASKSRRQSGFEVKYDETGKLINPDKVKRARIKHIRIENESSDSDEDGTYYEEIDEEEEAEFDNVFGNMNGVGGDEDETHEDHLEREPDSTATLQQLPSETSKGAIDLPYVFEMPSSYEALVKLFGQYKCSELAVVIERLIKCYHPSLKEGNKKRLARLFLLLLRPIQMDREYGARCVRALLKQHWRLYTADRHAPIGFRAVSLVRLVAALFPVTDFFHPVCTPTLFYATSMLGTVRVTCLRTAARLLVLVAMITEYIVETKRLLLFLIFFLKLIRCQN